jgi:hypothetical protein
MKWRETRREGERERKGGRGCEREREGVREKKRGGLFAIHLFTIVNLY